MSTDEIRAFIDRIASVQWADEERSAVIVTMDDGRTFSVPRSDSADEGNRHARGVKWAVQQGLLEILPPEPAPPATLEERLAQAATRERAALAVLVDHFLVPRVTASDPAIVRLAAHQLHAAIEEARTS